jgi:hypothetical protein
VNAPAQLREPYSGPAQCISSCMACPALDLGVCHGMSDAVTGPPPALMPVVEQTIPARRVIFRQRDLHDLVP